MSLIRISSGEELRPRHIAVVVLAFLTLAGCCLLTSGAEQTVLPDGARAWRADSLFRAVVELLNLNYSQPTPTGSEIKNLVFSLGTAALVFAVGVSVASRRRDADEGAAEDTVILDPASPGQIESPPAKKHIPPLIAAQILALGYVAWSFASILWSDARDLALYGSLELLIYMLWSFGLAFGLSRASASLAGYALTIVLAVVAAVAVHYTEERNPTLRASYPIGNPTFLAACLVPGLLIAACLAVAQVRDFGNPRRLRRALMVLACLACLWVMWDAFQRADSRGTGVGLSAGVLSLFFFGLKRRGKMVTAAVGVACAMLAVWLLLPRAAESSATGRDASLRLRFYSWDYALDLVARNRLLGHGQAGYVRKADALAAGEDVAADPEALTARIAHAHNEWLEIWADLGSVGLVVVVGMLLLTLAAGARAVATLPTVAMRWNLMALLASLVALIVEEASGVGLRVVGLPAIFFTVLGVVWAYCLPEGRGPLDVLRRRPTVRGVSTVLAASLAALTAYLGTRDFAAARAEHQVAGAIEALDWEQAIAFADQARAGRLSPQRRLTAQDSACAAHLHIARVHLVNGLRRADAARAGEPSDLQLPALASQDLSTAAALSRRGKELLADLARKAPGFYNSNWLEYGFEVVGAELARARGDLEAGRRLERNAAAALWRELTRRPYDANMAYRYVVAAGASASLEEIILTLARPLRYARLPAAYRELMARLLSVPSFAVEFRPLYERAESASPQVSVEDWADPFAPETLRLASIVWSESGDPRAAIAALEHASALYSAVRPRYTFAGAACLAELAERRFLDAPLTPAPAIKTARAAIKRAPPSYEGRQLARAVRNMLLLMQLAAGNENAARATIEELAPQVPEHIARNTLSERYTALVSLLMRPERGARPATLGRWSGRAVELDPGNAAAWQNLADIAFLLGDDEECVRSLQRARQLGIADQVIFRFVDLALQQRPTSEPLLSYSQALGEELNVPVDAAPPKPF